MSEWIKRLAARYAEVNESKFLIPEEIPTAERTAFMGAAAAAHKAGQTHFNFGGKKHKVTMKTDTAKAIADDVKESVEQIDELKTSTMQSWAKKVGPKIDKERNKVKAALDQPADVKKSEAGLKAMGRLKAYSKSSDTYVNKMTGRSKVKPTAEAADLDKTNADKAIRHDCATHVEHAEWGKGQPISEMHTIVETAPGEGYVSHYDVMFEHGIEKNVAVEDLTILAEMSHGHSRKKKNESDEVVMNPKKEKKEKASQSEVMTQESYSAMNEGSYERAAYGKGDAYDRSEAHSEAARDHEMAAEKHEKARNFDTADLHTAAAKAHTKAADYFSRVHNKGKSITPSTASSRAAHDASQKANSFKESTVPPVYARILESREAHYKKASKPEDWDEKEKNNKGAMDMKADHKGETIDNPEANDQMTKAANAAPTAAMRKGDNKAGDKKIIPSATPMKGM